MEIRAMEEQDAQAFIDFYNKLAEETDYIVISKEEVTEKTDKIINHIKKENKYKKVFLAIDDDKIVGFIGIKRVHFARLRHIAKVMIGVLSDYRKQGIGKKLMSFIEDWAKENDIKRLEATVIEENDSAVEFFEEMDFEKEGTRENSVKIDGEYYDELFMAKIIEEND